MMFVVFDLDGTLSDDRHRRHLLPNYNDSNYRPETAWRDYKAYHKACVSDPPIWPALRALEVHLAAGHQVEIWTGRSEEVREPTLRWFERHALPIRERVPLLMRTRDAPTAELKREWLAEHAVKPDLAYEDRADCAAVFAEAGVPCFLLVAAKEI